jgi:5S rRNA maturation endonuclease (ribonuclease M5)
MNDKKILLVTEGKQDENILKPLLKAAKLPLDQIKFTFFQGKHNVLKYAEALKQTFQEYDHIMVLLDSDARTIPDAGLSIKKAFSEKGIETFFSIQEIEAWIFADDHLLFKQMLQEGGKERLSRLPLPEEIPYPKQVIHNIFGKNKMDWAFLENIDVARATARTPSLKVFLMRIGAILDVDTKLVQDSIAHNLDRRIFANLIKELMYSNTIIYKTLDGRQFTAEQILENVEQDTEIAKEYTSDILRVARDFLKRQANKQKPI